MVDSYVEGLLDFMKILLNEAGDTVWLNDHVTVFDRCWEIVEKHEGDERLQQLLV